jgi:hypothetical protein
MALSLRDVIVVTFGFVLLAYFGQMALRERRELDALSGD